MASMMARSCVPNTLRTPAPGMGRQRPPGQREVARVHVRLARKRELGRLVVRALHQPDSGAGGEQRLQVAGGAAQVGLEAYADAAVALARPADEAQRRVHV